jgi:transposase
METRKKYDKAFKERAVKLMSEGRKVGHLSEELGVPKNLLYRWKQEVASLSEGLRFSGNGNIRLTDEQRRIKELEQALAHAQMEKELLRLEQEVLKKTIAIFSQRDRVSI